uniref:Domain of unknown function DB domain-containing protein n=1 Tax=Panagrolaimus davidi TaxID=227884 RepID=A0A914NXY3_9BILA
MKAVLCFLLIFAGPVFGDPNGDFAACCKNKNISDTCQIFCNYVSKSSDVLQAFTNGKCNIEIDGPSFYQCLENEKDNTKCCKAAGVGADASLDFCLDICDGSKPLKSDMKYFKCKPFEQVIFNCGKDSH